MEGGGIHYLLTLLLAVNNKIVQRAQHHEKSRQYYKQDPYDLAGGFFLVFFDVFDVLSRVLVSILSPLYP